MTIKGIQIDFADILRTLLVAAIVAGIGVYGQSLVTQKEVDHLKEDMEKIDTKLDYWYEEHQILKFHHHDTNGSVIYPNAKPYEFKSYKRQQY